MPLATALATPDPCLQLKAACKAAGFIPGGMKTGDGLYKDCINPILAGRGVKTSRSGRALPHVDPQIVTACRTAQGALSAPPIVAPVPLVTPRLGPGTHPNIVFILTDDLSLDLVQYMPHVLEMQKRGVTFRNYFVTDSLCCPSRSSIFTGRFPHDTGVFRNEGADGGYDTFLAKGNDHVTFAVALTNAAYKTAMMGKYLNGYVPVKHGPDVGWSSWDVAGNGYRGFNYNLNQDRKIVHYGSTPTDYMTDVLARLGVDFINHTHGQSFLLEAATFAPHAPYTPAPRDATAFPGLAAPRTLAFNAAADPGGPNFLKGLPALSDQEVAEIDAHYRKRAQSVLAVDAMIAELQAAVKRAGRDKNTYVIFSSDNGYHMGEHRMHEGKMTAYDTDIHVPLVITGPGIAAGRTVDEVVENVDLCPTFTELAGAATPATADGRSLVPLMQGTPLSDWRTAALIEHHGGPMARTDPDSPIRFAALPPTYEALRTRDTIYIEYADSECEYHDLKSDPYELHNTFLTLSATRKAALASALAAIRNCHDEASCQKVEQPDLGL